MEDPDTIHRFWFGAEARPGGDTEDGSGDDASDTAAIIARQSALWWGKRAALDAEIRRRFAPLVERAAAGELDAWLGTPRGRLALILLTDQFPRNIWRGSARAFAFDALARRWSEEAVAAGLDRGCAPLERVFLYLPLEHAEDHAAQAEAVRLFTALAEEVAPALRPQFAGYLDYARRHQAVIARFGRFPHRNALLGRSSTAAEAEFLRQPGSSF
jgi:uncharacterized protein (DUF924 family)